MAQANAHFLSQLVEVSANDYSKLESRTLLANCCLLRQINVYDWLIMWGCFAALFICYALMRVTFYHFLVICRVCIIFCFRTPDSL